MHPTTRLLATLIPFVGACTSGNRDSANSSLASPQQDAAIGSVDSSYQPLFHGLDTRACIGSCDLFQDLVYHEQRCNPLHDGYLQAHLSATVAAGYEGDPHIAPRHLAALRACVAEAECGGNTYQDCVSSLARDIAGSSLPPGIAELCLQSQPHEGCAEALAAVELGGSVGRCLEKQSQCASEQGSSLSTHICSFLPLADGGRAAAIESCFALSCEEAAACYSALGL